jgi:KUP system potassium uptake protein
VNALRARDVDLSSGILEVLSLIFWALVVVVCLKYLLLVTRADQKGDRGILALLALLHARKEESRPHGTGWVVILIVAGAAILYGEGVFTPLVSVQGRPKAL